MKICILSVSPRGNISATRIPLKNAEVLSANGHDVVVVFGGEMELPLDVSTCTYDIVFTPKLMKKILPMPNGFGVGEMLFRCWYVLKNRFDVIHACPGHRPSLLIPSLFAKTFRKTLLADEWWEWFGKGGCAENRVGILQKFSGIYDSFMELRAKKFFDIVFAISSALKERIPNHPNCIVLFGASESEEMIAHEKKKARETLNISQDFFLIGMSNADLGDHEDNLPFFKAFSSLCKKHDNVRLFITGDRKYIREIVMQIVPSEKVLDLGWLEFSDYNLYLSSCDMFILPFPPTLRNKGRWPNKIGDFISLKRPIISNPTGDVKTVVSKYNVGYLCLNIESNYYKLISDLVVSASKLDPTLFNFDNALDKIPGFTGRVKLISQAYETCIKNKTLH